LFIAIDRSSVEVCKEPRMHESSTESLEHSDVE